MRTMFHILIVVCALFVSSCASVGNNFKEDNIHMLISGSTTYDQACSILGSEAANKVIVAGGTQATWQYTAAVYTTVTENKSITILFDENDIMKKVLVVRNIDIPASQREQLGL